MPTHTCSVFSLRTYNTFDCAYSRHSFQCHFCVHSVSKSRLTLLFVPLQHSQQNTPNTCLYMRLYFTKEDVQNYCDKYRNNTTISPETTNKKTSNIHPRILMTFQQIINEQDEMTHMHDSNMKQTTLAKQRTATPIAYQGKK